MTFGALLGSLELGMIYAVLALGVFLSFRTLNMPDLTVDGSIVTGMAISAVICAGGGHPLLALLGAFAGGCLAGLLTGLLHTKLKIQAILAGILVMMASYSVNLRIMGKTPNIPLTKSETLYKIADRLLTPQYAGLVLNLVLLAVIIAVLYLFLQTRLGFVFRATGDNEDMVKACGVSCDSMKLLGLALSNGLVGLAGGLIILIFKPFKVGDYIDGPGVSGTIKEIQIFHTILSTLDNRMIYVPNGSLSGNAVTNYSKQDKRRVEWVFGVEYGEDVKRVRAVLQRIINADSRILDTPAPLIVLGSLSASSVDITVRVWVKSADYWSVLYDINEIVYQTFNEEGIGFPFPQLTVHQSKE